MRILVLIIIITSLVINCSSDKIEEPSTSSKDSLNWSGAYIGVLPCENCPGIETKLTLTQDNTYSLETARKELDEESTTTYGSFRWNSNGTKIELAPNGSEGKEIYYMVLKNRIVQLKEDAARFPEEEERNYILKKI